jgi:radical SAM-linked protein
MRIRLTFSKSGPLIYIGNLDLYTLWERAARRAGLPLAYSQGFHPQPKIHFGAPLPLGFSSRGELLDMRLNEDVDVDSLTARLNAALPPGVRVTKIEPVGDSTPALQTLVTSADYEVRLREECRTADLAGLVDVLLLAESLPRERRGKRYDLRPLIEDLRVRPDPLDGTEIIEMRLKAQEGATGRPDEVLQALGIKREDARIERTALSLRSTPGASADGNGSS